MFYSTLRTRQSTGRATKMNLLIATFGVLTVLHLIEAQGPPRLNIPGAFLVAGPQQQRPRARQQQNLFQDVTVPVRRKPNINSIQSAPVRETRPVVEEPEDLPQQTQQQQSLSATFDDEVAKLGISSLQNAVSQAVSEEDEQEVELPAKQVQFRPERPLPLLRQDIRERQQAPRPAPVPQARPPVRQAPLFRDNVANVRPQYRQETREEEVPVRRAQAIRPITQEFRQAPRAQPQSRPQGFEDEEERRNRNRKPPVQILRKYRTDNADGSITWGYENDDGTFKEENIGIDCITRGKYGYTDPDGVRREYTYETGGRCEDPEEELEEELPAGRPQAQQPKSGKKIYRLPA